MSLSFIFRSIGMSALWLGLTSASFAADWQWSTHIAGHTSGENGKHPQAFLWIPPTCKQVRGVVVGQHNMEEEPILEHGAFRAVMSEIGFAEIWISPGMGITFDAERGAAFEGMIKDFVQQSGYSELENAPVVPIGHSAYASFAWYFANWKPERTLAGVSVSGQWPWVEMKEKDRAPIVWNPETLKRVPGLVVMGEYEGGENRIKDGLFTAVSEYPTLPLVAVVEAGAGHFDASERKIAFIADYIRAAAAYRLPATSPTSGPVPLKPVSALKEGWRVERGYVDHGPTVPAAPVSAYTGDIRQSGWVFDEAMAKRVETFSAEEKGKKRQLVGYTQKDGLVMPGKDHFMVHLKFEPIDDGLTMKIGGAFFDTVPEGSCEKWTGLPKGSPIPHSDDPQNIRLSRVCGPVQQLGPDTFALRFGRIGIENPRRSRDFSLIVEHPGDATYRRSVMQSVLNPFPVVLKDGADQTITFPAIPDQKIGAKQVDLAATSSAGAKVHYYVVAGPAEVVDDQRLVFTAIPPRATLPITVTVVAWQWGRTIEPKLKSAESVTRTFTIGK